MPNRDRVHRRHSSDWKSVGGDAPPTPSPLLLALNHKPMPQPTNRPTEILAVQRQAAAENELHDRQTAVLDLVRGRWKNGRQRTTSNHVIEALELLGSNAPVIARRSLRQLERRGLVQSSKEVTADGQVVWFWPCPLNQQPAPRPAKATPAAAPEAPSAAAPSEETQPKRQPIQLPRDADELLALKRKELERIAYEVRIRQGRFRRKRGVLLAAKPLDEGAVAKVNGQISELGNLMAAIHERRAQLRAEYRRALGSVPERAEAIALAVDRVLSKRTWQLVQDEATAIQHRAEADLKPPADDPGAADTARSQ